MQPPFIISPFMTIIVQSDMTYLEIFIFPSLFRFFNELVMHAANISAHNKSLHVHCTNIWQHLTIKSQDNKYNFDWLLTLNHFGLF